MGTPISRCEISPLALTSTAIGFVSFAFTLLTFFNVFWASLGTFYAARHEINDHLSSLKQGLLEERRHLKRMGRRLEDAEREKAMEKEKEGYFREGDGRRARARSTSVPLTGGGPRASSRTRRQSRSRGRRGWKGSVRYPIGTLPPSSEYNYAHTSGETISLNVMRHIVHDMIREFREMEYPFLKTEYQAQDLEHWARQGRGQRHRHAHRRSHTHTHTHNYHHDYDFEKSESPFYNSHGYGEYNYQNQNSDDDDAVLYRNMRFGLEYRDVGLLERWKWINTKKNVVKLNESLNRIEIRRTAHEVGEVLNSVYGMGKELEAVRGNVGGLEARLNRVPVVGVGVRKVE